MALYVRLMVYMGLTLFIIRWAYVYLVVCVLTHITLHKPKLMFILHSSKMHNRGQKPQIINLVGSSQNNELLCPFTVLKQYLLARKHYVSDEEQFFVFSDRSAVQPWQFRKLLKDLSKLARVDSTCYGVQMLRAGRASDLLEMGISVDTIKKLGHWKSNSVYTYFLP